MPSCSPRRTKPRSHELSPGASPPPVRMSALVRPARRPRPRPRPRPRSRPRSRSRSRPRPRGSRPRRARPLRCRRRAPLPHRLVEGDRRRDRRVQRADRPRHRQLGEPRAHPLGRAAEPLPLGADHQAGGAEELDRLQLVGRGRVEADDLHAVFVQRGEHAREAPHPREAGVLDGPRAGAAGRGGERGRAILGPDDRVGADATAVRMIAPRLCGSVISSRAMSIAGPSPSEGGPIDQRPPRRARGSRRPRRRPLGGAPPARANRAARGARARPWRRGRRRSARGPASSCGAASARSSDQHAAERAAVRGNRLADR